MLSVGTTTIQVQQDTKKLLDSLKEVYSVKTYDQVINKLIQKKSKSMYGALADEGKPISMKEILKGLRDKHDRL
ncbi:MAG: hypothetical protein HY393_02230 [Candidatus Diapherotrites archaeon]|nr:hypothetical protein [Candidatus Diapherotrites archaeon]